MKNYFFKIAFVVMLVLGMTGCGGGDSGGDEEYSNSVNTEKIESKYFGIWHEGEASSDGSIRITYVYADGAISFVGNANTGSCYQVGELSVSELYSSLNSGDDEWEIASEYKDSIVNGCGTYESISELVSNGDTTDGYATEGGDTTDGYATEGGDTTGGYATEGGDTTDGYATEGGDTVENNNLEDNILGNWNIEERVDASECGEGIYNDTYRLTVTGQTASSLTINSNGNSFTGTFNGEVLSWSGSYAEDGGTTTSSLSATLSNDCDTFTGSSIWSWNDNTFSCSGTTTFTATKDSPTGCNGSENNIGLIEPEPIVSAPVEPVEGLKILSGHIRDFNTGAAIINAKVRLDFISPEGKSVNFSKETDANGYYISRMDEDEFSKYSTDESLIIYASKEGYIPITKGISINKYDIFEIDFELKKIPENIVVVEIDPTLHHLGDDSYSGSVNSKFQKNTEGLAFEKNFNVSTKQAACSEALLTFYGKGIQNGGRLYMNASGWNIGEGPSSGEFTRYAIPLDNSDYNVGENTIRIESYAGGNSSDYDDFEFNNIQIEFCP